MNSSAHISFGFLYAIPTAILLGYKVTPIFLFLVMLFSLLPDIDIPLSLIVRTEHRKYTHTPHFAIPMTVLIGMFNIPLAAAFVSHYAADYVYPSLVRRLLPSPTEKPVVESEYQGAALLGFSSVYSISLIYANSIWFAGATILSIIFVTMVATTLARIDKKERK